MSNFTPYASNLTEVYYKPEKTCGIEQKHTAWSKLHVRSESLSSFKTLTAKRNLSNARNVSSVNFSNEAPSGSITCLLSPRDLNSLFEGVMRSRWNAKQLHQADIERTHSVMVVNRDNSGRVRYTLYTGCVFATVGFTFQINSHVTFAFNVNATFVEHDHTLDSRAVFNETLSDDLFIGRDGRILKDGVAVGAMSSMTGSMGHTYNVVKRVNLANPFSLIPAQFDAELSLSGAFANSDLLAEHIAETSFELEIMLQYKQDVYRFNFPHGFLSEITFPSGGEGAIIVSANVTPIHSPVRGSTVIIKQERV